MSRPVPKTRYYRVNGVLYRLYFGTLHDYFADAVDEQGRPVDTSTMKGWAYYVGSWEMFDGETVETLETYGLCRTVAEAEDILRKYVGGP